MSKEEMDSLLNCFRDGNTTPEENALILSTIDASSKIFEFFLNEIKIAKLNQGIKN